MITAQTTQLANERNAIEIQRRRIDKSVLLIKALGGGWDSSKLPQFRPRGSYGCTPMSSKLNRRIRKFGWLQALDLKARYPLSVCRSATAQLTGFGPTSV